MAGKYDRTHMRRDEYEEEEEETRRSPLPFILIGICLIVIAVLLIYSYKKKNTTYTSWEVLSEEEETSDAEYLRTDDGYIRYNRDGAAGYDNACGLKWQISYDLTSPIAAACGDYSVFADKGAGNIYVSDGTGSNYWLSISEDIEIVRISQQGRIAILADDGLTDHIYIYSYDGELLLDIETSVKKSGFPITIAFSPDGHKLVTSYLKVAEEQESRLTFYNLGDVGQNYTDKIVGSYTFEGQLLPDVRFVGNDNVCVISEDSCTVYKFKEIPEEITVLTYNSGISGICSNSEYFALAGYDSDGSRVIDIYSVSGDKEDSFICNIEHDGFAVDGEELILTSGSTCVIYTLGADEKIRMKLDSTVKMLIPSTDSKTYIAIESGKTAKIGLKTASDEN